MHCIILTQNTLQTVYGLKSFACLTNTLYWLVVKNQSSLLMNGISFRSTKFRANILENVNAKQMLPFPVELGIYRKIVCKYTKIDISTQIC